MKQMLINYIVKPETAKENAALIKDVFEQLKAKQLKGVKYSAYKMGDNVFVHVAQFETEAARKKFTSLTSFGTFRKNITVRQMEAPITNDIEEIGSFSSII